MNARRWLATALILGLAAACSGPAAHTPSPATSPAGSGAIPEAIVGTWTTTITEADLRAAGVTGAGELGENAGEFTMQLGADGTWSIAQVAPVPLRWPVFKGTFEATGPDTFRQVTTFPADFAGDSVDFRWSLKDGGLVLKVLTPPDHILPILTESHPWQPKR